MVSRKILIRLTTLAKSNGTCTQKNKYGRLPKNARFLMQWTAKKTTFFQTDSFDSSDNNLEDYSLNKVQESFSKRMHEHPSYF